LQITSRANIALTSPQRTLQKLCKHFNHKVNAHWQHASGEVDFGIGECKLQAAAQQLLVTCHAQQLSDLNEIEHTIERHIGPMSGQPNTPPVILWHR
jgi:hypothetical protein